jgi:uncharacterized repeat protein (TIGR01451 family)
MKTRRFFASLTLGLGLTLTLLWLLTASPVISLRPVYATSSTVTNIDPSGPGSLRQAILDAEADSSHDTIDFAPDVSGTIMLTAPLVINYDLTIDGPRADELAVSGADSNRVFLIKSGAAVTITGLTIRDGYASGSAYGGGFLVVEDSSLALSGTHVISNRAGSNGGGLYLDSGTVLLQGTDVARNRTADTSGWGGGLYVADGSVTLRDTTVVSNWAGRGGGVHLEYGSATLTETHLVSNTAAYGYGGGMYVKYGSATLIRTQVVSNSSHNYGGGLFVEYGSATLFQTDVLSNSAANDHGGGLYLWRSSGVLNVTGGRVEGNSAGSLGGGVYVDDGSATLTDTYVVSNSADSGGGLYVWLSDGVLNVTGGRIENNTATYFGGGVYVHQGSATLTETELVSNTVTAVGTLLGFGGGLYVGPGSATLTGTQVVNNSAHNVGGLYVGDTNGAITATNSCIVFNSDTAVHNPVGTLDASDNWWGMPDGPSGPGGTGRGDSVGTNVTFNPYKSSPPPGCLSYVDLLITKAVTPTTDVAHNGVVTYTVRLENIGIVSDTNVLFTDSLPAEVDFASWVISPTGTLLDSIADEITWSGTIANAEAVTWTFTAVHVGDYADVVTNTGEFSGTVRAGEVDAVFNVVGPPEITVDPLGLSFGGQDVDAGPTLPQTVTITNDGSADLSFTAPVTIAGSDAGAFVIASDSGENPLPPGSSRTVQVSFDPTSAGARSASLSIESDDSDEPTVSVALSGTGTEAREPGYSSDPAPGSAIDVGTINVGSTGSATLTISETGEATLVVTPSLSGPDVGHFGVTPSTLTILDGEAAKDLTITCTPSVTRTLAATLTVAHNATGGPALYPLSCTGEPYTIFLPLVVRNN